MDVVWHALRDAFLMAWEVWWALVLGFFISAVVQAWVPRRRIESALAGGGVRQLGTATGLGAVSSSCSYAAVAIAKSLFQKGASAASALAFQIASTNLVWELGLVLWVLIGWQFTLGEYLGGIVMIGLMALLLRLFVSPRLEESARDHAQRADSGHQHHSAGTDMSLRRRLRSSEAWADVAYNFRGDWKMTYKEVAVGFLLAGLVAQVGNGALHSIFLTGSPPAVQAVWGAFIGPVIAVLSFVCSVGNVPLAAVLWSGGISFAGVMAFIFADLIVLPIIAIYRKYYGVRFALRITAVMFVAMVIAAVLVDGAFSALGLVPQGARPTRTDIFSALAVNYKLFLNVTALLLFVALFWLTARRGATDPVCGMKVERRKALAKRLGATTFHFCSEHCLHQFEAAPYRYLHRRRRSGPQWAVGHHDPAPEDEPGQVRPVLTRTR
ncbi:MAG: permease [Solirubrobacteraceae bacterium]